MRRVVELTARYSADAPREPLESGERPKLAQTVSVTVQEFRKNIERANSNYTGTFTLTAGNTTESRSRVAQGTWW